jgi:hypothetical protein
MSDAPNHEIDLTGLSDQHYRALVTAGYDPAKIPDDMLGEIRQLAPTLAAHWDAREAAADPTSAAAGRLAVERDPRMASPAAPPAADRQPSQWDIFPDHPDQGGDWSALPDYVDRSLPDRAGRLVGQFGQGANEALYRGAMALPDLSGRVAKFAGLVPEGTPLPSEIVRPSGQTPGYSPPENRAERIAGHIGTAAGDTAALAIPFSGPARAAAVASQIPRAAPTIAQRFGNLAGRTGTAIREGATTQPLTQTALSAAGNVAGDETGNKYVGMAVPFALGGLVHMGQRALSSAAADTTQELERRALLQYGNDIGGKNTAGKITGSNKLQTFESAMDKAPIPFLGQRAAKTEAANRNAYQRKALESAGVYGETAATPNVTEAATNRLGARFENLTRDNTLKVDQQFGADLREAKANFSDQLESQMPKDIRAQLDELASAADALKSAAPPRPGAPSADKYPSTDVGPYLGEQPKPNPQPNTVEINGRTYQNIRSKLSKMLDGASGTDKQAIGGMINALDGMAERSLPKDVAGDFREVRRQYRNLMAIKNAVGSANNPSTALGNIPTARFAAETKGNPDLERLGQYGAAMVGDKVPNSGTASRHAATGVFGSIAAAHHFGALTPSQAVTAAAGASLPYVFDAGMNNPVTRQLLLARYRNPSKALLPGPVFGGLAGHTALEQGK